MKCKYSITIWLFLAVLLLVACDNGERQRLQLAELERQNRADSLMLNDSLARDLADWFDRHGTRNEQMRAYYILGRTYADRGESPAALDAYNDAADRADTTAQDCDYHTLCRVYSQMATVFFDQNLIGDNLRCLDLSMFYAYKANDTIAALNSYGQKLSSYEKLELNDSIISVCENTYNSFCELGHRNIASRYLAYGLMAYTATGAYDNAKRCMDIYESESGYFYQHNIELGRESYYSLKGDYYLAIGHCDSAEFFYRKELSEGADFNNQTLAAQGLSKLYNYLNISDSVAKYALYAYAMNDSNYHQMTTTEIDRIQSMYDYSRHQRMAQLEKERADQEQKRSRGLLLMVFLLLFLFVCVVYGYKKKRKREYVVYMSKVHELELLQTDMLCLRSHEKELGELLCEKEATLNQLRKEVAAYQRKINTNRIKRERMLIESAVYIQLQKNAIIGKILSSEEWHELNRLVIDVIPEFYHHVTAEHCQLSINEYRIVLLIRLHIPPMSISKMMDVSAPYVSKVIGHVSRKIFQEKYDAKMLEKRISEFC